MKELIETTLKQLGYYSEDSVNLLLGTMAQESAFGKYRKQINGPALGIFQMEPNTFNDIVNNFLKYKPELKANILEITHINIFSALELVSNDKLSICFARVHYMRNKQAIPNTIEGYAAYWKKYYNTIKGKGTEEEFIRNYKKYVLT